MCPKTTKHTSLTSTSSQVRERKVIPTGSETTEEKCIIANKHASSAYFDQLVSALNPHLSPSRIETELGTIHHMSAPPPLSLPLSLPLSQWKDGVLEARGDETHEEKTMAVGRHQGAVMAAARTSAKAALDAAMANEPEPEPLRIARELLAAHVAKTPLTPPCEQKEHYRKGGVLRNRMEYEEKKLRKAVAEKISAGKKAAKAAEKAAAKAAAAAAKAAEKAAASSAA